MTQGIDERYKVDATRGSSRINPLNYKGDVLVQVWMDSRVLATMDRWLETNGGHTRFMSEVVRRPLEVLFEILIDNGDVVPVDDTTEARVMLSRKFGVNLNRGRKGLKNTAHNVVLSNRREELAERIRSDDTRRDIDIPSGEGNIKVNIDEAMKIMKSDEVTKRAEEIRKMREGESDE